MKTQQRERLILTEQSGKNSMKKVTSTLGPFNERGRVIPGTETSANNNNKKMWKILNLSFLLQKWYMFIVRGKT